jgi:hypothetical protein
MQSFLPLSLIPKREREKKRSIHTGCDDGNLESDKAARNVGRKALQLSVVFKQEANAERASRSSKDIMDGWKFQFMVTVEKLVGVFA